MSTVPADGAVNGASPEWLRAETIRSLPLDRTRGTQAMWWFIGSEALVFIALFFSYFYLGHLQSHWPTDSPPHLPLSIAMLVVLLVSCGVLWLGRRSVERAGGVTARLALLATIVLGCGFLALNALDYNSHARDLPPTRDSYSSIFYVIEGVHAAHLILGLLFLIYALFLPRLEPTDRPPHRPYYNAALYWYFVTLVYVAVFLILYIVPNVSG